MTKENGIGETTPGIVPWPPSINETGLYGLGGQFVKLISPHTEADPNALLLGFLTFAGNAIGRNFYLMAGPSEHCGNLFTCLVGNTGHGRKGSAIAAVEAFFKHGSVVSDDTGQQTLPPPKLGHIMRGIQTGEGVVYQVHDDIFRVEKDKRTGDFKLTLIDKNEPEKRLLIILEEFHQCLANMHRPDSILSSILRQAWDNAQISTPAKTSKTIATGASISIYAAMSREELLDTTGAADAENGTLNRFNFCCCRRSKLLPQGGKFKKLMESAAWAELQQRFKRNISEDDLPYLIERDEEANLYWGLDEKPTAGMYRDLNQTRIGLWGAITARAPQIVLRIALITCVINGDRAIRREHLEAAYEIWRYCDDSAKYIFGDKMDDPTATDIMNALRAVAPAGLTRTQIHRIWKSHRDRTDIDRALLWISHTGIARCEKVETGGRPIETWYAI